MKHITGQASQRILSSVPTDETGEIVMAGLVPAIQVVLSDAQK
jgi:hypothetical protein